VIRKGSDITLIGWGAQLAVLKEACEDAAKVSYFHLITIWVKSNKAKYSALLCFNTTMAEKCYCYLILYMNHVQWE
jgi:hypothetical protein